MTIQEIITHKEDQTFDCKSIQIDPKALAITIVAFANADGGDIAIGVSDKTRKIEGVDQHTEKLNELLRVPLDFCNPSVSITSDSLPCTDKDGNENHILLMHIPASSELHTNQADEAFMRVGDKSRKLSFEERIQLMYDKGERYYEDTAVYGATVDDIDMAAVVRYTELIGYTKSAKQYLQENNGFLTTNAKGEEQVSVACILLFGKYPQKFFPRGRTRFIRYKGTEERVGAEMNVIKDVTFEGTILDQVKATIAYLETQVEEHTFLGLHGQFVTNRDYPKFVIQEMVVNACCHRAYNIKGTEIQIKMLDDRLVFESPGRLPGMVKPSNIRHTHFSRNPKIAQFLKAYDFVKEFGEGVDRVCRELEANRSPIPTYHLDDFILKITVPKVIHRSITNGNAIVNTKNATVNATANSPKDTVNAQNATVNAENATVNSNDTIDRLIAKAAKQRDKLTANRISILRLMVENPYITKEEMASIIGLSGSTIMRNIEFMRGKYLRRVGSDKSGFWEIIE